MTAFKCRYCPETNPLRFYWDKRRNRPFKRCVDCWNKTRREKRRSRTRVVRRPETTVTTTGTAAERYPEKANQRAGPLDAIEQELFPGVPYHQLTDAQRDLAVNLCKKRLEIPR
jgi:hypothetical protein